MLRNLHNNDWIARRGRARRAFTLLELILVMMIAATLLALAAPSLTNWSHGQKLRNAAENFVALTHYARAQAVMNGAVYRVQLGDGGTFSLLKQQGTDFVATHDSQSEPVAAPDGGKVELTRIAGAPSAEGAAENSSGAGDTSKALDFDPTGRCPTATIKFYDGAGKSMTIENTSPLQQFHLVFAATS